MNNDIPHSELMMEKLISVLIKLTMLKCWILWTEMNYFLIKVVGIPKPLLPDSKRQLTVPIMMFFLLLMEDSCVHLICLDSAIPIVISVICSIVLVFQE